MEHTLALRAGLPDARLAVIPGTGHGFLGDKPGLCNRIVVEFLEFHDRPHLARRRPPRRRRRVRAYIRDTGFPEYGGADGNRGAWMLRRDEGDKTEFLTLSFWESRDAITSFAGEDIEAAVLYPEDDRFLTTRERPPTTTSSTRSRRPPACRRAGRAATRRPGSRARGPSSRRAAAASPAGRRAARARPPSPGPVKRVRPSDRRSSVDVPPLLARQPRAAACGRRDRRAARRPCRGSSRSGRPERAALCSATGRRSAS